MIKRNEIRSVPTYHTMMSDAITEVQYRTVEVAIVWSWIYSYIRNQCLCSDVEIKKLNVTIEWSYSWLTGVVQLKLDGFFSEIFWSYIYLILSLSFTFQSYTTIKYINKQDNPSQWLSVLLVLIHKDLVHWLLIGWLKMWHMTHYWPTTHSVTEKGCLVCWYI
jgi:hypothetical protein